MGTTFELAAKDGSVTVGRYGGRFEDERGSRLRYSITDYYGRVAQNLTRADLAILGAWIVAELDAPHEEP